ncbi:RsmB/NOP family class I SAM-dependent RNA methyltransferase [Erythrobacter sp.]|jgi:16S rRNA (cytosine967-C5)-methyltransferase|uniref:RsmB/NOP family class I SAM-dependent RNA methyltransferase n=1 Tax=Erythrobacter sp. TaxID=1042 RepID=UPI002EBBB82E|nr:RsmB/NOP family class I SAM-dependent RNA methyltransferase [Erythrobacter sp.]
MTPAARVQAAIELLDAIIEAAQSKGAPADRLIAAYFKQRRYAGSKDRRAVRELVYRAVRLCGEVPASGREAMLALAQEDAQLAALFDGSRHGPAPIGADEQPATAGLAPQWLSERLAASGIDARVGAALLERAPLDLRVNALKARREALALPEPAEPLLAPHALRLEAAANVEAWPEYRAGFIEIQDHGSQWMCEAVAAEAGETIVDLCAGAGGKTLALAAATGNDAEIIAADTDKRRLGNLAPRAERAGARIAQTLLLDPGREMEALRPWEAKADRVLVDAPCSGSGTWRRNPESRWRLTPAMLGRLAALQDHVLDIGAQLVRPGGTLVFVTCSLLDSEGPQRIDAFLARHPGWRATAPDMPVGRPRGKGLRLTPYHDGTDGFFVAILRSS